MPDDVDSSRSGAGDGEGEGDVVVKGDGHWHVKTRKRAPLTTFSTQAKAPSSATEYPYSQPPRAAKATAAPKPTLRASTAQRWPHQRNHLT